MMPSSLFSKSSIFALIALTTLSACPLERKKTPEPSRIPPRDARLLKKFETPGAWICRLSVTGADPILVSGADRVEVTRKLIDECSDTPLETRETCVKAVEEDQGENPNFICGHASLYVPKYREIAKAVGHWTCRMNYSYTVEVTSSPGEGNPEGRTPRGRRSFRYFIAAASVSNTTVSNNTGSDDLVSEELVSQEPASEASPMPSPTPSPSPAPRRIQKTGRFDVEGTTSYATVALAFETCLSLEEKAARESCVDAILDSKMRCWNKDVSPNARPKRIIFRH